MSKAKASIIMALFITGAAGLWQGLTMQISFEPTDDSMREARLGNYIIVASLALIIILVVIVKRNHSSNKNR
jgi:hypothetical protein